MWVPATSEAVHVGLFFALIGILLCFQKALFVAEKAQGKFKMFGVLTLIILALSFLLFNSVSTWRIYDATFNTVRENRLNTPGMLLVLGAGAILFGFLDNYGMKLGTDALEDGLFFRKGANLLYDRQCNKENVSDCAWEKVYGEPEGDFLKIENDHLLGQLTKGKLSFTQKDLRHYGLPKIKKNYVITSQETKEIVDGEEVLHQIYFKPIVTKKIQDSKDFRRRLLKYKERLEEVQKAVEEDEYIKKAYESIDQAKSMLGNTFSDFVGALLGAGITKVFHHYTGYDGNLQSNSPGARILQNPAAKVFLESGFIALGCLIPVFMHFQQNRKELGLRYFRNSTRGWAEYLIGFILLFLVIVALLTAVLPKNEANAGSNADIPNTTWWDFGTTIVSCLLVGFIVIRVYRSGKSAPAANTSDLASGPTEASAYAPAYAPPYARPPADPTPVTLQRSGSASTLSDDGGQLEQPRIIKRAASTSSPPLERGSSGGRAIRI